MAQGKNSCIQAYGVINKDRELLRRSSSGGVVSELCREIFDEGGVACACAYDYDSHKLRHILIEEVGDLEKIRGSKYFQSDISGVFKIIERILAKDSNKRTLFIGTPCQCAAIKRYLNVKRVSTDALVCVDIICHGVGSNRIWSEFVRSIEEKKATKIVNVSFKDKRRGWLLPYAVANDEKGREFDLCDYMTLYNKGLIMREECHACPFASLDREGDVTVGDFWSVQKTYPSFYNPDGVSSVLCNTEKGRALFLKVIDKFNTIPISLEDCLQPNMKRPTLKAPLYDRFWSDYDAKGLPYVIRKYASKTLVDRIRRRILVKLGIWKL